MNELKCKSGEQLLPGQNREKVYCEGSSADGSSTNINSILKGADNGKITEARYNISNASNNNIIIAGDKSTISNNINPVK